MATIEVKKCDVCGRASGRIKICSYSIDVVQLGDDGGEVAKTERDLCERCVARLLAFVDRGINPPTTRAATATA